MAINGEAPCHGLHVLLVEDEAVIAMLTEAMLAELGCHQIRVAGSVARALVLIDEALPDLAVLDVNLRGELVLPVAQRLADAGVPFAFVTGYGRSELLSGWQRYPIVEKPFDMLDLENALKAALGAA